MPDETDEPPREAGRRTYGHDGAGYDAGRPGYPERVVEILVTRCGLTQGTKAVEVGPGTGQATRRLGSLPSLP